MEGDWHPGWSSCDGDPCAAQGTGAVPWNGTTFLAITPQPSFGTARITYALRAPMSLRLEIMDAAGRVIRRLVDGAGAAGPAIVEWDGRDDAGRRAAPGTYFCRLSTGGEAKTERLVRIE
jgi:flagellar hook assembly protein FlgD